MAEIILMKTLKILLSILCYSGTGFIFIDQKLEGAILEALQINPVLKQIILTLLIILWVIKIVWFTYSKFYLESKERKQVMRDKEKNNGDS